MQNIANNQQKQRKPKIEYNTEVDIDRLLYRYRATIL